MWRGAERQDAARLLQLKVPPKLCQRGRGSYSMVAGYGCRNYESEGRGGGRGVHPHAQKERGGVSNAAPTSDMTPSERRPVPVTQWYVPSTRRAAGGAGRSWRCIRRGDCGYIREIRPTGRRPALHRPPRDATDNRHRDTGNDQKTPHIGHDRPLGGRSPWRSWCGPGSRRACHARCRVSGQRTPGWPRRVRPSRRPLRFSRVDTS